MPMRGNITVKTSSFSARSCRLARNRTMGGDSSHANAVPDIYPRIVSTYRIHHSHVFKGRVRTRTRHMRNNLTVECGTVRSTQRSAAQHIKRPPLLPPGRCCMCHIRGATTDIGASVRKKPLAANYAIQTNSPNPSLQTNSSLCASRAGRPAPYLDSRDVARRLLAGEVHTAKLALAKAPPDLEVLQGPPPTRSTAASSDGPATDWLGVAHLIAKTAAAKMMIDCTWDGLVCNIVEA